MVFPVGCDGLGSQAELEKGSEWDQKLNFGAGRREVWCSRRNSEETLGELGKAWALMDTGENQLGSKHRTQHLWRWTCRQRRVKNVKNPQQLGTFPCALVVHSPGQFYPGAGNVQLDEVVGAVRVLCMDKMSQWRLHRYLKVKIWNISAFLLCHALELLLKRVRKVTLELK